MTLRQIFLGARRLLLPLVLALFLAALSTSAQAPTAPPGASIASELLGATVYAANGSAVGEVAAVTVDAKGEITEMSMNAPSPLGIGERTVILPAGRITVLRGAVVLDMSPSEVDALPSTAQRKVSRRISA